MNEARTQVLDLIDDLCPRVFDGIFECRVSAAQRLFQFVQLLFKYFFRLSENAGGLAIKTLLDHFCDSGVQAFKEILKLQVILLQSLLMTAFYDRETRSRQHARLLPPKRFVYGANLRKVSNLSRASDICGSRQKIILYDGPERHVRAEAIGTPAGKLDKLFFAE